MVAVALVFLAGCCPPQAGVYHAFGSVLRGSVCDFLDQTQKAQEGGVLAFNARCGADRSFLARDAIDQWIARAGGK